jgi:hypothetical protein
MSTTSPSSRPAPERHGVTPLAFLLLLGAQSWVLFYWPPQFREVAPFLSLALFQVGVWSSYAWLDRRLAPGRSRFLLSGLAAILGVLVVIDAGFIRVASMPLFEALPLLWKGGNPRLVLEEMGIGPGRTLLIVGFLVAALLLGGLAGRLLERFRLARPSAHVFGGLGLLCLVLFVGEQVRARNHHDYLYRGFFLPAYPQLFATNDESIAVALPPPVPEEERLAALARVPRLTDAPDVLLVLLESFRGDALDPEVTPHLWRLRSDSLVFAEARTEAIFTPLAWNLLFMAQPAYRYLFRMRAVTSEDLGSWNLAVLHAAGYEVGLSFSTNLAFEGLGRRLLGDRSRVDRYFSSFEAGVRRRWEQDARATEELVTWLEQREDERPFFYLLQLDSTHWTYEFDEAHPLVEPFADWTRFLGSGLTEEEIQLFRNRYTNACHYVDEALGRVLAVLDARGAYEDTVVVVVSDHGEGFEVGRVGHFALHDDTQRVPMMLKLPGVAPHVDRTLVGTRDLFPTLFDHLGLGDANGLLIGESRLAPAGPEEVLVLNGAGWRARLVLPEGEVHLRVTYRGDSEMVFTPYRYRLPDGGPRPEWKESLARLPLEEILRRSVDPRGRR